MLKFVIPVACMYGEPLCDEVRAQFYLLIVLRYEDGDIRVMLVSNCEFEK